ncbi:hypothetical protein [Paenibacillus mucilaginosus]|uniref:Uncharacterized protein n=1 Tax=Paenibacillus mucilaginosus (strain KNP414) TaxID=1036673 RepID=F8FB93_PAEMK|nr:hypothetical protein [Paenibacillus mucilaginosus]AEI42060.1 hypothetical protein KNP414_03502 [Paenibacillus mucilaginosus KNP414]MCG7217420.1 hypothetical protein [Paenibacillus mucilaginosus]WDM28945.1 hypothetical protein KCX80_07030 [Paenibacillus mucilaginosus]
MQIRVIEAAMTHSKEDGYRGYVQFHYGEHKQPYELALFSKRGIDWDYSLIFAKESGPEEEILIIEDKLEKDDDFFDELVDAAYEKLEDEPSE